jgi:hypothetical protein
MTSAKLKVAVLYDIWEDETAAAEVVAEEKTMAGKPKPKAKRKPRTEKEDREEIFEALEKLGHEPFYQVLDGRPQCLTALAKCDADLVFNLTESFAGDDTKEMNVAAYMDLLDMPYTGGGPHAHFLAQDKGEENVRVPRNQNAILRNFVSRPHRACTRHFISFDRETGLGRRFDRHQRRRRRGQREGVNGTGGVHPERV